MSEMMKPEYIGDADRALLEKKKLELEKLLIPDEEEFNGNSILFKKAMEDYLQKRAELESSIKKLTSTRRDIARGGSTGNTLN